MKVNTHKEPATLAEDDRSPYRKKENVAIFCVHLIPLETRKEILRGHRSGIRIPVLYSACTGQRYAQFSIVDSAAATSPGQFRPEDI
ncbi:MAG: hypothetical protein OXC42_01570, partial [Gammaproteobacteria bacterium]|nr:hypothetical protein [Gammaproteobacteria bacterium]